MTDLSSLSDAELLKMYGRAQQARGLSSMSDADLLKAIGAKEPDKYQQAAQDEIAAIEAKGGDVNAGVTRRLAHGATLGADSTLIAAALSPVEAIRRGVGLKEGYNYAKAWEDAVLDKARKDTGMLGSAAEILGGGVTGANLARGGLTAARALAPDAGLAARAGASATDAAAFGGFAGAMEGNGAEERLSNAAKGAVVGGLLGGIVPPALAVGRAAISPVVSNIRARANPESFAQSQVARAVSESGMTPQQIASAVEQAAIEGQPVFTVADAMGNAGQRMLSSTARAPGQARTDVVNFLDSRQADQGRRVANSLAEGFDAPRTAAQTREAMVAARDAAANAEYGAARSGAGRVDVVPAINQIDRTIGTQPGQMLTAANDSIEGALRPFRERLARINPDDFDAVHRLRSDMADAAQAARQGGAGNRARLIGAALRELDSAMEAASPGFRQANANYRQASRDIDAIAEGRMAATRGRTEDTIPAFRAQSTVGQQGYRVGYADPLIEQAQGAAFGVNKARPFTSDAFQAEAKAIAPGNDLMQRRLARENTMFQTRNSAVGNSKTAENLADDAAMGVDPTLIGQVLSGNWQGALRSVIASGSNAISGNTPAVRKAVADMLLERGAKVGPAKFEKMITETIERIQKTQRMARSIGRGAAGGLAVAGPWQSNGR